jgi:hydroxymethylbilane synthase
LPSANRPLRIGTRRSKLALAQAEEVQVLLAKRGVESELVPMTTSGDRGAQDAAGGRSLPPDGIKGLFVQEIVRALQDGEVDLAVHSAKDLPSEDPEGVLVAAVPERGSPFDVLVSREVELPDGATIGTSSLRRRSQILRWHRDARPVDLRGNVDTRVRKLADGEVDALVLAEAGLARLGIRPEHASPLSVGEMVPAPGQGALAVQTRAGQERLVKDLDHEASRFAFEAERRLVALLGGGCALPVGAYAEAQDGSVHLRAVVLSPDGTEFAAAEVHESDPETAATQAVEVLHRQGADRILAEVR